MPSLAGTRGAGALAGEQRPSIVIAENDSIDRRINLTLYFMHCGRVTTSAVLSICYRRAPQIVETHKQTDDPI
jgi:hypothetical protein